MSGRSLFDGFDDKKNFAIIDEVFKTSGHHTKMSMVDNSVVLEKYFEIAKNKIENTGLSDKEKRRDIAELILREWGCADSENYFDIYHDDEEIKARNIAQIQMAIAYAIRALELAKIRKGKKKDEKKDSSPVIREENEIISEIIKVKDDSKDENDEAETEKKKKAIVLIDGPNYWHSLKELKIRYVNYGFLIDRINLFRPDIDSSERYIYFPEMKEEVKEIVKKQGIKVLCHEEKNKKQRDIDNLIKPKIKEITANQEAQIIILFSGDKHFLPALEEAKDSGIEIIIVSYQNNVSNKLTHRFVYIDLEYLINQLVNDVISYYQEKSLDNNDKEARIAKRIGNLEINFSSSDTESKTLGIISQIFGEVDEIENITINVQNTLRIC